MEFLNCSKLMQTLVDGECNEAGTCSNCSAYSPLPRPIDDDLRTVLQKLPDAKPLDWRAICHVAQTKSLRPDLFGTLTGAQLDALEELIEYYMFPKEWATWVQQERAARSPSDLDGSPNAHGTILLRALADEAVERTFEAFFTSEHRSSLWNIIAQPFPTLPAFITKFVYMVKVFVGHRHEAGRFKWSHDEVAYMVCEFARFGDLAALHFLHSVHGVNYDVVYTTASRLASWTCEQAASHGHLDCLKWLRQHGYPWGRTSVYAYRHSQFDCLAWAIENGCPSEQCPHCKSYDVLYSSDTRYCNGALCPAQTPC